MKNLLKKYKKDIIIIGILLTIAIVAYLGIRLYYGKSGDEVQVFIDGQLVVTYDINENNQYKVSIGDEYNEILIEDRKVSVSQSSCENQVCVKHMPISDYGESIICLPHKLVVKINKNSEMQKESKLDGVAE